MGPQFNVFSKLRKMEMSELSLCEDGTPEEESVTSFFSNPQFPAHISGLDSTIFYRCNGKRMRFGAATYQEYQQFKHHLSRIAGFQNELELIFKGGPIYFVELLNFSDSEGTIGPMICKKLYNDFKDNYDIAEEYFTNLEDGRKFWIHYQNWCKALSVARQNGAILIT